MPIRFQILGSSSSGNCALLETASARVLVDAGFSARKLGALLAECGLSVNQIDAVFLTHEHSDHAAGIKGLAKFPHLEVFANHATAQVVQSGVGRPINWRVFTSGSQFVYRDLTVHAIPVPHDALDPVAFVFRCGGDSLFDPPQGIAWLTDLGHIPPNLGQLVRDVDVLIIEANHDLDLLEQDTKRPFSIKLRIRGRHGHLSNVAVRDFLAGVADPRWKRVFLTHISRDCNSPQRVASCIPAGTTQCPVHVVDPDAGPSGWFACSEL
jgi:phosphoribosyl 1,2-cyclic phosphodiesterase